MDEGLKKPTTPITPEAQKATQVITLESLGFSNEKLEKLSINQKLMLFGYMLTKARSSKTPKARSLELRVSTDVLKYWEKSQYVPSKEMVPKIAESYNIDPTDLERAFDISSEAFIESKKNTREARKPSAGIDKNKIVE